MNGLTLEKCDSDGPAKCPLLGLFLEVVSRHHSETCASLVGTDSQEVLLVS